MSRGRGSGTSLSEVHVPGVSVPRRDDVVRVRERFSLRESVSSQWSRGGVAERRFLLLVLF